MSERITTLLGFTAALVLTIAALFLVTAWNFQPADIAFALIFLIGVAVNFWIASVIRG